MSASAPLLQTVDLGPQLASRRLLSLPRQLCQVAYDLPMLLDGGQPLIPALPEEAAGYRMESVPSERAAELQSRLPDMISGRRQSYPRHYIDMSLGYDAYLQQFSGKTRSTLRRKAKKVAALHDSSLDIREYHSADALAEFFPLALALSSRTYQDKYLDAGLPDDAAFQKEAMLAAGRDAVRAYLLFVGGQAVSYLYLPIVGETVRYDYLGYDPDFARHSVGTVLQMVALERLMAEDRYRWFDFTSGDGAHKRLFATGQVACESFLMLRPTLANQTLLATLDGFDGAVAHAGDLTERLGVKTALKKLVRR